MRRLAAAERELVAAFEALKGSEEESKELRLWVPGSNESHWRVDGFGVINGALLVSRERALFGNAIRTEAEAKRHSLRLRAFNLACRLATEAGNPGGLRLRGKSQWYIWHSSRGYVPTETLDPNGCYPTIVYFPSHKSCEQAIKIIGQETLDAVWGPL